LKGDSKIGDAFLYLLYSLHRAHKTDQ